MLQIIIYMTWRLFGRGYVDGTVRILYIWLRRVTLPRPAIKDKTAPVACRHVDVTDYILWKL